MEWRHTSLHGKPKPDRLWPVGISFARWFGQKNVLLDCLEHGETVYDNTYCKTIPQLHRPIQNKRCDTLSHRVASIHDNAGSHTSDIPQRLLTDFGWETSLLYLAPSNLHLLFASESFPFWTRDSRVTMLSNKRLPLSYHQRRHRSSFCVYSMW